MAMQLFSFIFVFIPYLPSLFGSPVFRLSRLFSHGVNYAFRFSFSSQFQNGCEAGYGGLCNSLTNAVIDEFCTIYNKKMGALL